MHKRSLEDPYTDIRTWNRDIFIDLYARLRESEIPVTLDEWSNFLKTVESMFTRDRLEGLARTHTIFSTLRTIARVTLVKDVAYYTAFHEVFDSIFGDKLREEDEKRLDEEAQKKSEREEQDQDKSESEDPHYGDVDPNKEEQLGTEQLTTLPKEKHNKDLKDNSIEDGDDPHTGSPEPKMEEQLGTEELTTPPQEDSEHDPSMESAHGGDKDQHNDILQRKDSNKIGGGDRKLVDNNNSKLSPTPVAFKENSINLLLASSQKRREISKPDVRYKDQIRPTPQILTEIIRSLREIIISRSAHRTNSLDINHTVRNFARKELNFVFERDVEKKPDLVLLIDIGGTTDTWIPLLQDIMKAITEDIFNLKVYLFHNNIYGYVWEADPKDIFKSNYAKPNSLLDVMKVISGKRVIIYGDANMADSELHEDNYPPEENEEKIALFSKDGLECLESMKKKARQIVWVNPLCPGIHMQGKELLDDKDKKRDSDRDDYEGDEEDDDDDDYYKTPDKILYEYSNRRTFAAIDKIFYNYDLTWGGLEKAAKELMS